MSAKSDEATQSAIREMTGTIGELTGTVKTFQTAVLQAQLDTNAKIVELNKEIDGLRHESTRRHDENVKSINERHGENARLLLEHKNDDQNSFAAVNNKLTEIVRWKYVVLGGWAVLVAISVVLWKVLQVILPYLELNKLGE